MTFISLKKSLIAALAACTLTASAAAAPSPETQLATIANAQEVWKYEFAALCAPDELPFHLRAFAPAETLPSPTSTATAGSNCSFAMPP